MFSLSVFILTACVGDLDPDGGWAAPVVDGDHVYIGAKDGRITRLALNEDGRFDNAWGFPAAGADTLGPLYGTPRVDGDRVFGATYDCDNLDCEAIVFGASVGTGQELWRFERQTQVVGAVAVAGDTVLFGTAQIDDEFDNDPGIAGAAGYLYAIDTSTALAPTVLWRVATADAVWGTPVIFDDVAYFGDLGGVFHAVSLGGSNGDAGSEIWTFKAGGAIVAEPLIADGKVYFGDFSDNFYALDIAAREAAGPGSHPLSAGEWSFDSDGWFWATPLIHDNVLYVGTLNGKFYALDPVTGSQLWEEPGEVDGQIVGRAAVFEETGKGPALAVPSGSDNIGAFMASNGSELNGFITDGGVKADLLVEGAVLYAHTTGDDLIRFKISDHGRISCVDAETGAAC
ncbi:MAG: PQQ-binding-like beta-propeller repeat protein [Dehalococcoidia bacterium]|nr:PQQ-binding-like beta-propeller repeat protein [Dehalococcoidia bacterium]